MYILYLVGIHSVISSRNIKVNLDFKKSIFFEEKEIEKNIKFEDNERNYANIDHIYITMGQELKNMQSFSKFCRSRIKCIENVTFILPINHQEITKEFMKKVYEFCNHFRLHQYNFVVSNLPNIVEKYHIQKKCLYIDNCLLSGFIKYEKYERIFFIWKSQKEKNVHSIHINTSQGMKNEDIVLALKQIKPHMLSLCEEFIIHINMLDQSIIALLQNIKEQKIIFKLYNSKNLKNSCLLLLSKLDICYLHAENIKIHINNIYKTITIGITELIENILEIFEISMITSYIFYINTPNIYYCLNMIDKTLIMDKYNLANEIPIFDIQHMIEKQFITQCTINEKDIKMQVDFKEKKIYIIVSTIAALEDMNIFSIFKSNSNIDNYFLQYANDLPTDINREIEKLEPINHQNNSDISIYTDKNTISEIPPKEHMYSIQPISHKNSYIKHPTKSVTSYTESLLVDKMTISSMLENDYYINMDLYIEINEENLHEIYEIFQKILSDINIENAQINLNFCIEIKTAQESNNIHGMFEQIINLNESYNEDIINISYIKDKKKHKLTYTQFLEQESLLQQHSENSLYT